MVRQRPGRLRLTRRTLPALAVSALAMSGCAGPLSTLDPVGPGAASIATLFWVMLWGSVALFALVIGLLMLTLWKPGFGRSVAPAKWIVHGGLVMPTIVLTALVVYALVMGERLIAKPVDTPPHRIAAHADQWSWTFSYPDLPGAEPTVNLMHMPVGEPVDIVITSADVIHSFWVPRLGGKLDAIPGHENVLRLQADRPGTYGGVCAEFCGTGHTGMIFDVEAHAADDYFARGESGGEVEEPADQEDDA